MGISAGQKLCLWLIFFGSLAIIIGSVAPFWMTLEVQQLSTKYTLKYGLWFACVGDKGDACGTYNWGSVSVWFLVLHVGAGIATLLAIVLMFVSLVKICGKSDSVTAAGVIAMLCGLLGVTAAVVFLVSDPIDSLGILFAEQDWAYIVFFLGACIEVVFSIALCLLPRYENNSVKPV